MSTKCPGTQTTADDAMDVSNTRQLSVITEGLLELNVPTGSVLRMYPSLSSIAEAV